MSEPIISRLLTFDNGLATLITDGKTENVYLEEICEIPILIPSEDAKREAVAVVYRRRAQARQLRKDPETGWSAAFEERLLGA